MKPSKRSVHQRHLRLAAKQRAALNKQVRHAERARRVNTKGKTNHE